MQSSSFSPRSSSPRGVKGMGTGLSNIYPLTGARSEFDFPTQYLGAFPSFFQHFVCWGVRSSRKCFSLMLHACTLPVCLATT
jgi:hypothetical protein